VKELYVSRQEQDEETLKEIVLLASAFKVLSFLSFVVVFFLTLYKIS
jgi:hypothetical protein